MITEIAVQLAEGPPGDLVIRRRSPRPISPPAARDSAKGQLQHTERLRLPDLNVRGPAPLPFGGASMGRRASGEARVVCAKINRLEKLTR